MARSKGKSATELNNFTIIHNEFIETNLIDCYEKLVFIAIKRHLNNEDFTAFPSIKKICSHTRLSKPTVVKAIRGLEEKHIITVEHRESDSKGHMSNLYTLYDYKKMWKVSSSEEVKQVIKEVSIQNATELLQENGFEVIKKESAEEYTDQSNTSDTQHDSNSIAYNYNAKQPQSQDNKAFSRLMINEIYDYNILINDYPEQREKIDIIFELLLEILNSKSETIRVNNSDTSKEIVKGRLLKLTHAHIIYVINQFNQQTQVIKNIRGWMLTSLFNSYTTMQLHYNNLANHNLNT